MNKESAIVLFSGGIDCSLAACLLVEKKYKVHLMHYNNGTTISNSLHNIRYNELKVYFAEINGEICPQNEIKEFIWIDKNYEQNNIKLGTILSKYVIPSLVDLGLM